MPMTRPPDFGVCDDGLHRGREPRDGARAQIIAVAEPAGHDDAIDIAQRGVLVPDVSRGLAEHVGQHVIGVLVAIAAGELDDAKPPYTRFTYSCIIERVLLNHRVAEQFVAGLVDLLLQLGLVAALQFDLHELADPHLFDARELHRFQRVLDGFPLRVEHGLLRHDDDLGFIT